MRLRWLLLESSFLELLFMQYGLSEKFDGIVRMVLVVAAVVRDVLEKSIAISNLDGGRWL